MEPADYRNIERETKRNKNYRKVLRTYTGKTQLVLMSLRPKEDVPWEVHKRAVQFIRVEEGKGYIVIGDMRYNLGPGLSVMVPPGARHYIANSSASENLQMYILYSPPQDPRSQLQRRQP